MIDKHKLVQDLGRKLADEGRLVEAGWQLFAAMTMPPHINDDQRHDMRIAFFSGAQHVFHTLINIMEEGDEVTGNDMARMDKLNDELSEFAKFMAAQYGIEWPPK